MTHTKNKRIMFVDSYRHRNLKTPTQGKNRAKSLHKNMNREPYKYA